VIISHRHHQSPDSIVLFAAFAQIELENLNTLTDLINKLELELDVSIANACVLQSIAPEFEQ
jgi:hypothetical protein